MFGYARSKVIHNLRPLKVRNGVQLYTKRCGMGRREHLYPEALSVEKVRELLATDEWRPCRVCYPEGITLPALPEAETENPYSFTLPNPMYRDPQLAATVNEYAEEADAAAQYEAEMKAEHDRQARLISLGEWVEIHRAALILALDRMASDAGTDALYAEREMRRHSAAHYREQQQRWHAAGDDLVRRLGE